MRQQTVGTSNRGTIARGLISAGAVFAFTACNSLDEPPKQEGSRTIIPIDVRPAQQALQKLPAISGGTLAASSDGRFAIAADPDRDRVSIVDLDSSAISQVAFEAGDEPGRVVTDAAGHAYVALRHAGDVARIDIARAQVEQRTHVCAAPRGLALDQLGLLHVACADGRLVSLHTSDGSVARDVDLKLDLRDVLVRADHLLVSTFKSAQLLAVDNSGKIDQHTGPLEFSVAVTKIVESSDPQIPSSSESGEQSMQPHLAWRMVQTPTGDVVMLHQGASMDEVDITKNAQSPDLSASPYGGGGGSCGGIVTPAITTIGMAGLIRTSAISSGPVSVDMAVSTSGAIAVVQAGTADAQAPRPSTVFNDSGEEDGVSFAGGGRPSLALPSTMQMSPVDVPASLTGPGIPHSAVMLIDHSNAASVSIASSNGCDFGNTLDLVGQATAVTFTPVRNEMLVQSREPALITRISFNASVPSKVVMLGGESVLDSGHEIFHRDAGGGIACASCHAEGAEDGHTWKFTGLGERRTQALHVGLEGTAPFHWSGDERDLGHLMEDVFVGRMGGVHQSSDRLGALTDFLFSLRAPAPSVDAHADAAVRGKALFESASTGCTTCHSGAKLTNSKTVDVGTGGMFQVPSLVGIGYRAPLMHTGCAATLADRFNPACGGSKHGNVDGLSSAEVGDMVAYLRTL